MGYILAGDTRLQKIFLLLGPPRAGKGTIARVLAGLLGKHNVVAPTLASLSTNFGLWPLIGKPLAVISDVRLSDNANASMIIERLLSISGEDRLTIDRKYLVPWTGQLPTRLLMLTNELPRLVDASGALISRFIVFVLTESFYGRENPRLTDELLLEAPSILNWALEGLDRLNERGSFELPPSATDTMEQFQDLSSPIKAFVREQCEVASDHKVSVEALWTAWKRWSANRCVKTGIKEEFGRNLHAAVPTVKRRRPRTPQSEDRPYVYEGIGLRDYLAES
jgi:putative DNA primase/helicase